MMCDHSDYVILRKRGRQELRKCKKCEEIFTFILDKDIKIKINAVISYHDVSQKKLIDTNENKVYEIGDIIKIEGKKYLVNYIDTPKKVYKATAKEIKTIYLIPQDIPVVVKISLQDKGESISLRTISDKERIFSNGDFLSVGHYTMRIEKILTSNGKEKTAKASEIKRIYCSYASNRMRRSGTNDSGREKGIN